MRRVPLLHRRGREVGLAALPGATAPWHTTACACVRVSKGFLANRLLSSLEHFLESRNELGQRDIHSSAKRTQLHEVDPTFAPFAFANEGLSLTDLVGKIHLRDALAPTPGQGSAGPWPEAKLSSAVMMRA